MRLGAVDSFSISLSCNLNTPKPKASLAELAKDAKET